jgi:outer membrane protein OmpA-like peptidoglycan-associated protein
MTLRAGRFFAVVSIAASSALFVASCSLPPQRQVERGQASDAGQRSPVQHIAQLDFGRDASFAVCTEPACPVVTHKTLAVTQQAATDSAALAPAPSTDTAATLDVGDAQPTAQHGTADFTAVPAEAQHPPVIVHFAFGSAALSASDKAALDQAIPDARKADRIVIAGRTDSTGSDTANQVLALARVRTVRDYLRARLPSRDHALVLDAQGACCFIASNDTPQGRRQNRRVEIVFSVPERVAP